MQTLLEEAGEMLQIDAKDQYGRTALHVAAAGGHAGCVGYLVANLARINEKDGQGRTALMLACAKGHAEVVTELVQEEEVDVAVVEARGGNNALLLAIASGDEETVSALMADGGGRWTKDMLATENKKGQSALYLAAEKGMAAVIRACVEAGLDVRAPNREGTSCPGVWG